VKKNVPEADGVLANTSGFAGAANAGNCTVTLVPPDQRHRTQQQIADALAAAARNMNDARTFVTQSRPSAWRRIGALRSARPVRDRSAQPGTLNSSEAAPQVFRTGPPRPAQDNPSSPRVWHIHNFHSAHQPGY
jgi:ABC-type transporter Mla subunit MlaD